MRNQIDLFFDRAFRTPFSLWDANAVTPTPEVTSWFRPPVDVREDDKAYYLSLDLPGLKKEDVKIDIENGVLNVSGERQFEHRNRDGNWQRTERAWGQFHRRFTLPDSVELEKIEAKMSEGVLELTLPKTETQKARVIAIK